MGILLCKFLTEVRFCGGWWSTGSVKTINNSYGKYKQKILMKPLWAWFRKWSNRIFKFYCNWIIGRNSFNQTVFFLDWKSDLQQGEHVNCEKNLGNLLVEMDNKKHTINLINLNRKTWPHEKFDTSKGVIRNRVLTLAISEEIKQP